MDERQLVSVVRNGGHEVVTALGLDAATYHGSVKVDECFDGLGQTDQRRKVQFSQSNFEPVGTITDAGIDALRAKLGVAFGMDRRTDGVVEPAARRVSFGLDREQVQLSVSIVLDTNGKASLSVESPCIAVSNHTSELGVWSQ